ncbi:L-seryl-tRNA(Sec) kinase [Dermacentor albipictus]|uniref:L-seryl-tRNA(Sec) kinase n=1 Tax=Dermacentor albipictus TaxID=60249 RepID=UPI0031FCCC4E
MLVMTTDHASMLALFCGLPASGKTTLVQSICTALESRGIAPTRGLPWYPCVICYDELVSTDAQAEMAHNKGLTKESRQHLLEAADHYIRWLRGEFCEPSSMCTGPVKEMLNHLKTARRQLQPDEKPLIMVDDNLYYRSMRAAWFRLARKYSLGFCQVFLLCSTEEAIRRNSTRVLPVPELTIKTMVQKFELPRDEPWEQHSVAVDGGPGSMEKVMAILETASKEPWSPVDTAGCITEPTPASQIHIWDLQLRAIVSKLIRQAQEKSSKSELQACCLRIQKARQNVLDYLRTLDVYNEKEEVDLERLMQVHLDSNTEGAS